MAFSWNDLSPFYSGLQPQAREALGGLSGATVYHLAFQLSDPPTQAHGVAEIYYTNTEGIPLDEIYLALFPNLLGGEMEIVAISANGHSLSPERSSWLLRVPLSFPLEAGKTVSLHIEFMVTVPSDLQNSYYGILGYNEGILSFAHGYPTVLVYNEEGWNNTMPDLDGDPLFADPSFYVVSIDAPAQLTLVTSGVELERSEKQGRQQVLIANGPARDFYLCAAPGWQKHSQVTEAGVQVNLYAPAGLAPDLIEKSLSFGASALDIFSRRYGDYPYTEFDIAPIVTFAGGVEYPGMTAISQEAFDWGDYLEMILVHEAAHAWFYNLVGNDTQDEPWLDEAAAQFATWQYFYDRYGEEAAEAIRLLDFELRMATASEPSIPIGLPVAAYTNEDYAAIVYGRGPLFFLALREQMGEETFDRFLRQYVATYAWRTARAQDFHALAETVCACDLDSLFAEWVYP
ncbi:MAG: M1 family metallopeptidase [Anaerolineales bacterium]|nr:M1 family metallopeptidase [Anaerolineales bacterium]MCX7608071.1 M1 family metallopeptidase [Anaerolineales bacterium]MDW8227825.1 M1 family metallopeptidase [Anaerolineales bacterium]